MRACRPRRVGRTVTTAIVAGDIDQRTRRVMELLREGKSDKKIGKRLRMSADEVRAAIDSVIRSARLDDAGRVEVLAEQVGIARPDDA